MQTLDWNTMVETLTTKLMSWAETTIAMLPNLIIAAVIVMIGVVVARRTRSLGASALNRIIGNQQLSSLGGRVLQAGVVIGAAFVALGILGLDKTVTSLLAGVGIAGIALGFAFQDIAANFMAGVLLAARRPMQVGDLIETNDISGTVLSVDLRATTIRTFTGETVIVPNKDVFGNPIVNYTQTPRRRVDVTCGVSYADDLQQAERLVLECLDDLPGRLEDEDISFIYTGFGGSSIDFAVRVWLDTATQPSVLNARSEIICRIKRTFDEHGISIPFPIRTMDFGVAGGVALDSMLATLRKDEGEVAEAK